MRWWAQKARILVLRCASPILHMLFPSFSEPLEALEARILAFRAGLPMGLRSHKFSKKFGFTCHFSFSYERRKLVIILGSVNFISTWQFRSFFLSFFHLTSLPNSSIDMENEPKLFIGFWAIFLKLPDSWALLIIQLPYFGVSCAPQKGGKFTVQIK